MYHPSHQGCLIRVPPKSVFPTCESTCPWMGLGSPFSFAFSQYLFRGFMSGAPQGRGPLDGRRPPPGLSRLCSSDLALTRVCGGPRARPGLWEGRSPSCFHLRVRSFSSDLLFLDHGLDCGQRVKVQDHTPINLHRIGEGSKHRGARRPPRALSSPSSTKDSLGPDVWGETKKIEELGR